MTTSKTHTVRCSNSYLRARLAIELVLVAGISIGFGWSNRQVGMQVFVILGALVWLRITCMSMYRFLFGEGEIRTRKIFTRHPDVTIPSHQIQSVSAYEGILEALFGAGTIEVTTASSDRDHAKIIWPHVNDARTVAEQLRSEIGLKGR